MYTALMDNFLHVINGSPNNSTIFCSTTVACDVAEMNYDSSDVLEQQQLLYLGP